MRKYPNYKATEVKGIPSIPKDWAINKIKFVSKTIAGGTPDTKNVQFWENGTIPWLPSGKVHDCNIYEEDADTFITELGLKGSAAKLIPKNSILIALTGATCANIAHLHFSATANQSVVAMPGSKKIENRYLFYCLLGIREQILINKTGGAQSGINDGDIKNTQIPYPSLPEQLAIVRFLDYKTGQIDSFIANRQKQIELLKEQKAGIINKAVTKGINPNAKMKDSGLNWLPEIPVSSEVMTLKHLVKIKITDGPHLTPTPVENGIPFISAEAIQDHSINFNSKWGDISYEDHLLFSKKCKPQNGDIFIVKSGATTGKVAYVNTEIEFNIWSPLALVRADEKKVSSLYLFYYIISKSFLEQIQFSWSFGTQQNIGMGVIQNLKIITPSLKQQNEIVELIKSETLTIDTLISKYQKQIDLMQEYRTSSISQAVTGKIDVREWEPKKQQTA